MNCCYDLWIYYTAYMIFIGLGIATISLIWWIVATIIDSNIQKRLPNYYKQLFKENDLLRDENRRYKKKFGNLPKDS